MQQEQLLRSVISAKETMMGSTPNGADWCIKALHPSDPLTQVKGIPDMSAATSLCMNYQTTYSLSARPAATGTWQFDATLLPHPIDLMAIQYTDSVGADTASVLNSQMTGALHSDKVTWLVNNAQQWRLVYAGVTVTQDGPDLANQGTLVVAQAPVIPYTYRSAAPQTVSVTMMTSPAIEVYTAEDLPSYASSQASPNAYFDQSKKGAYIPLKLTKCVNSGRVRPISSVQDILRISQRNRIMGMRFLPASLTPGLTGRCLVLIGPQPAHILQPVRCSTTSWLTSRLETSR